MSKFNSKGSRPLAPVLTTSHVMGTIGGSASAPDVRTYEGAPAWSKDARTDLFLRATSSFHGNEGSFYESGEQRDDTLRKLTRQLAIEDFPWICRFAEWLRTKGNIRTAALMIAADAVKARLTAGRSDAVGSLREIRADQTDAVIEPMYTNRWLIDVVCQRADEPGELLAYWLATYGRKIPKPVKRGLSDAARRLYNERSLLKYDTSSRAVRFADVLELCHPSPDPAKLWQGDLFKYAIERRHNRVGSDIPATLAMIQHNGWLREQSKLSPHILLREDNLRNAGMTWEDALSLAGGEVSKKEIWEAVIPSMGYMALLRNLRNFDEAGISNEIANQIILMLSNPEQVAKSRQLPFRFYSAYKNVQSLRWSHALEIALDLCLPNIPTFTGRTLVLVDTSGSMENPTSDESTTMRVEAAALFGSALALKNPDSVDLYQFANKTQQFSVPKGGSVLRLTNTIMNAIGQVGHGTEMAGAIRDTYRGHDRVILLSDMQAFGGYWGGNVASGVPADKPVYAFNLSSYSASPMPTGGAARFDLGGLTDATFSLIPRLEAGKSGAWPWEVQESA